MVQRRAPFTGNTVQAGVPPSPSTSFAGPIYANEAAASAGGGLADGQQVFILSHRSIWISQPSSTLALSSGTVIARSGGGRLIRTTYSDPSWRTLITDIYVNDVTGTNENTGIYQATPGAPAYITGAELSRRWGRRNTVSGNMAFAEFVIHVGGASSINDLDCVLDNSFPQIFGENSTTVLAGNLDGAGGFTAQNPATNAACQIKVGAQAWGAFLGKRIRFTATGAVATILKDLGAGSARISQPGVTNEATFDVNPTATNPANGAAFLVEDLVSCQLGHVELGHIVPTNALQTQFNVLDVALGSGGIPWRPTINDGDTFMIFYQCGLDVGIEMDPRVGFNGCTARQGIFTRGHGEAFFYGGAVAPQGATAMFNIIASDGGSLSVAIDYFAYFQGCCLIANDVACVGGVAIYDAVAVAGVNPNGHAFMVGGAPGNTLGSCSIVTQKGASTLFGSGNAGAGVRVAAGCSFVYSVIPAITGTGGDSQLGDVTSGVWWNAATSVYNPVGGVITLTWAHITAAKGAAGFGGGAHDPDKNAHIILAAAS